MPENFDDDGIERRPEDYLWQPGEREQVEREQAQRRREIERAEMLQWCEQRNIGAESVVTKSAPATQRAAAVAPRTLTAEWQSWIEQRIKRESRQAEECMAKAIAQSIGKDIVALERSNAELRDRVQHLENEVADLFRMTRQQARDAEIAERFKQYDELQERLDRLEGGGRPLKVVG